MKIKAPILFIILLVLSLASGVGLYLFKVSIPNIKDLNESLDVQISELKSLDTNVNLYALRNRTNIDSNYDDIVYYTKSLDKAVKNINESIINTQDLKDSLVEKRYNQVQQSIINKIELIENFKTHNSVLRNSEIYTPIVGKRLLQTAQSLELREVELIYRDTIIAVMEYSSQEGVADNVNLAELITKLPTTEALMPDESLVEIIEFTSHANTVLFEKSRTDIYLTKAIDINTSELIDLFQASWDEWTLSFEKQNQLIEKLIIAYIAFLILILTILILMLRSLYKNLENKVKQKTDEVQQTFEELQKSEGQLMQAEKMSSLGQLVAGISHEINTPLGFISSNLSTVENNLDQLNEIYEIASLLSDEISKGNKNSAILSKYLKKIIISYRALHKEEIALETKELLKDSVTGLDEISQLVISLNEFSRIDDGNSTIVNIQDSINSAIKISATIVGSRKIIESFTQVPDIEFAPVQLNQVFLNVLTNAAHATDSEEGTIEIITKHDDKFVTVEFVDNGKGMTEEVKKHIFDPFFTTKDVNKGTGLGMSISYKVITSNGGDIAIQSELDKGSKIILTLPIKRDQA